MKKDFRNRFNRYYRRVEGSLTEKRYLDTSKNKDVAISNIYRIFENSGGECLHEKTNKPTIEMINKYIKEGKRRTSFDTFSILNT